MGKTDSENQKVKSRNINRNVNSSTGSNLNGDDVNRTIVLPILKCLYTNADQFTNKITELIVRARDKKLDIIEITEVKPKNSRYKPHLAEYSLTEVGNYKMF